MQRMVIVQFEKLVLVLKSGTIHSIKNDIDVEAVGNILPNTDRKVDG